MLALTPEMHSNIILDLWETSKIFGIDPVIASGGRFEGYCPRNSFNSHTALYCGTQRLHCTLQGEAS